MAMVGHLREFSLKDSDWSLFLSRLESYLAANNIDADQAENLTAPATAENAAQAKKRQAILLNCLDEDAYKLLFDLVSPEKPEEKTYKELVAALTKHFQHEQNPFAARFRFYAAMKEAGETAKQWAARLRGLAVACKFGDELKVCLRDKFVFGFEKGIVLDKLMEQEIKTDFESMVTLADSKMAANEAREIVVKREEINQLREHMFTSWVKMFYIIFE